jgi:hypothetical protein
MASKEVSSLKGRCPLSSRSLRDVRVTVTGSLRKWVVGGWGDERSKSTSFSSQLINHVGKDIEIGGMWDGRT